MQTHLRSSRCFLLTQIVLGFVILGSTAAYGDLVINGTGSLTVNGTFFANQNFTVEFEADQPAVDMFGDPSRGLFIGTTTLTIDNAALGVTDLESTNVNALRQDQSAEGLFLASSNNAFNAGFSAVFNQGGVIADPNVLVSLSSTPESANWQGAGLLWQFTDGTIVRFNQASNLLVSGAASVPEPATTSVLIGVVSLLAMRRRKTTR